MEALMNADELMLLDRPLTPEESAFLEQEVLKLAKELEAKVTSISEQIDDPEHQYLVDKLRGAAGRTVASIEAAIAVDAPTFVAAPAQPSAPLDN
jgi:hypothetical protein